MSLVSLASKNWTSCSWLLYAANCSAFISGALWYGLISFQKKRELLWFSTYIIYLVKSIGYFFIWSQVHLPYVIWPMYRRIFPKALSIRARFVSIAFKILHQQVLQTDISHLALDITEAVRECRIHIAHTSLPNEKFPRCLVNKEYLGVIDENKEAA